MSSRPSRGAARLAAILDALPDGLVLVNSNGTVVNANTIALETFETPGTALVGRGLLDLLPEFDPRLIPGSMRRPEAADERGLTKPTRMVARRTDGTEFPVEVTSANLEDGRQAYNDLHNYTGDELLMLVVRDLSGTVDTEAELARSQRQTEMILRAAAEGVVGTDTDGRVVLVNPAAAQILGFRATDLGGRELHPLILHSRADGEPFPYDESPLADTLRSGRKHRVRGQVLWAKNGKQVPVDLTTAPVRDGEQLVGAVMTFTDRRPYEELVEAHTSEAQQTAARHAAELKEAVERHEAQMTETVERHEAELAEAVERHTAELADRSDRYAAEIEELAERYDDTARRHHQLTAVLGGALRGPLEELRGELSTLAADPAGQLWPEANQMLHHLAAGYARMTTLVDNVLGYQRLDEGLESLTKVKVLLDGVVAAGVEGAIELIGPGRAQFAVHAPPIEAEVDPVRLATALAHLTADVAGVDSTGRTRVVAGGGYVDSTIVVAAAQRGDVVRIEVRGPFAGGDPVHEPIVRGIVRAHGGVLQTHEMPGMGGSAYVLEVPLGEGSGTFHPPAPEEGQAPAQQEPVAEAAGDSGRPGGGRRRARRSSTDAFLGAPGEEPAEPTGRRRARPEAAPGNGGSDGSGTDQGSDAVTGAGPGSASGAIAGSASGAVAGSVPGESIGGGVPGGGTGRRRGRPSPAESAAGAGAGPGAELAVAGSPVAPASPVPPTSQVPPVSRNTPAVAPVPSEGSVVTAAEGAHPTGRAALGQAVPPGGVPHPAQQAAGTGRRARHGGQNALPALPSGPSSAGTAPQAPVPPQAGHPVPAQGQPAVRRPRRALAPTQQRPAPAQAPAGEAAPARAQFALPPADADRAPVPGPRGGPGGQGTSPAERHESVRSDPHADHTPLKPHPITAPATDQRRAGTSAPAHAGPPRRALTPEAPGGMPAPSAPVDPNSWAPAMPTASAVGVMPDATGVVGTPGAQPSWPVPGAVPQAENGHANPHAHAAHAGGHANAPEHAQDGGGSAPETAGAEGAAGVAGTAAGSGPGEARVAQPLPPAQPMPEEEPVPADSTQGRAFSVRTLGQGVPFSQQITKQQNQTLGAGRRRRLSAPQEPDDATPDTRSEAHADARTGVRADGRAGAGTGSAPAPGGTAPAPPNGPSGPSGPSHGGQGGSLGHGPHSEGRAYAIGAPDDGAEGPQPLDGPGGAVEVANRPQPRPVDDELPPEPLDNPRRLLVWPAPDVSTQQALSDRGYRPVIVHSREEVDAQIAAFPAALFVDPLTGPITRTALQSLRQAAVAAEVPVLVTAGLGQATREEAYGADPAVLLKALAPRDSEQHPSRVLLIEESEEIALALTATLERRGMQVARAGTDSDAVTLASQMRPNLVVMDLMQVRRRRAGIIDWLRANGQLNRTPLVVYTSTGIDRAELPQLSSGETVLFLAERSTSEDVQARIVELLAKIGTN
ncbi:PAS domain-containing protein [Streptomyces sp. NBC_01498]|uniref:response regulator n=1 Tax=Streptomyces sp. NBC_01498 TaxID=2975870 RepID=UPI002E7AF3E8|nr:PAS domain-containing protein [Streptomyces sp. NBC_01498]WTL25970.1 PAS domain-containing protein [Streptomyces sp. NBC_01498]